MTDHLVARPLTAEGIARAYALLSLFDGELSLGAWKLYAEAVLAPNGPAPDRGIMTVQSGVGFIYGLSGYGIRHDLRRGRILEIENFAVADLIGASSAAEILLSALESLARDRNCGCVSVRLLTPRVRRCLRLPATGRPDLFEAAGYRAEPLRLGKCF